MLTDKVGACCNVGARQFRDFVSEGGVGLAHDGTGRFGFGASLLAFGVLREDLIPERRQEDATVVAGCLGCCGDVGRHGEAAELKVAQSVGNAVVEDYGARERPCGAVGAQVPFQHPSSVGHAVSPGEGISAALPLHTNDHAAGFGDRLEAAAGKLGYEAGLARAGGARHDEKMVAHGRPKV